MAASTVIRGHARHGSFALFAANDTHCAIRATSLHYLSLQGIIESIGVPEDQLNTSCFTGVYPIGIGERAKEIERKGLGAEDIEAPANLQAMRHGTILETE